MIIFIDKQNCINLHNQLIDQYDKYKSYMLMQTIVGNVNHIHFNFDKSEIIVQDEDLKRFTLWGNVEGVGNTTFSYKNSSIEDKFTGIHPPLSSSNRFDTNFPFNDLYQEYLSSAFMLDVKDDIKEYKRKVMICGIGEEMELMKSIYKLATSGNFNLIEKPLSYKDITQSHKKLFPEDIPFTYIIVDDPYFSNTQNYNNRFIESFYSSINSIVQRWKTDGLVDQEHKVQILIYHDSTKNAAKIIKYNANNITVIIKSRTGHDRWIYTNYYALASGYGFVAAGETTYMRFPRMGSNAAVINKLLQKLTPNAIDKVNVFNKFYQIIDDFLNSDQCKHLKDINIKIGKTFNREVGLYFNRTDTDHKEYKPTVAKCRLAYYVLGKKDYFNQFRENLKSRAKVFEYLKGKGKIDDQTYHKIDQYLTKSCLAVFAFRIIPFLEDIREKLQEKLGNAKTEKTK